MSLKTLVAAVLVLVSFGALAGAITISNEWGVEWRYEDHSAAMHELTDNPEQFGEGSLTIMPKGNLALYETLDFSCIERDITLDLNGGVLTVDERFDWFVGEFLKIDLSGGYLFTLRNGTVTGARLSGAVRICSQQRVLIENVTFENNSCDETLGEIPNGDAGGAIRCSGELKLVNCTFRGNMCTTRGGAVSIYGTDFRSRYVIEGCTFENNTAGEAGGALFLGCSGLVSNTTIRANSVMCGQGGGVYLTRHAGMEQGWKVGNFWWDSFEGPTLMIDEGVNITGNTASPKQGAAAQASNLYLMRSEEDFKNAAVMVSGDTSAGTSVGLTLSNESDVFTRILAEYGGDWLFDDYSSWFFGDKPYLVPVYDAPNGLMRIDYRRLLPGEPLTVAAEDAEGAAAIAKTMFAPPKEVAAALDDASVAEYREKFVPVVSAKEGSSNEWEVKFELTPDATNEIQTAMSETAAHVLPAALTGEGGTVEMSAIPGFYYAMSFGPTVSLGFNPEGKMATGHSVEIEVPSIPGSPAAFYRITASPNKIVEKKLP